MPIDRLREILKLKPSEIEDILRARGEVAREQGEIDPKSLPVKIERLRIKLGANDVDLDAAHALPVVLFVLLQKCPELSPIFRIPTER